MELEEDDRHREKGTADPSRHLHLLRSDRGVQADQSVGDYYRVESG